MAPGRVAVVARQTGGGHRLGDRGVETEAENSRKEETPEPGQDDANKEVSYSGARPLEATRSNMPDSRPSENQHRITEGVEAVAFFHCLFVRVQDEIAAGEGRDQHNECRAGKVEVGHHRIHRVESMAGQDEEVHPPLKGIYQPIPLPSYLASLTIAHVTMESGHRG